jgi:heat shock protein HslJ
MKKNYIFVCLAIIIIIMLGFIWQRKGDEILNVETGATATSSDLATQTNNVVSNPSGVKNPSVKTPTSTIKPSITTTKPVPTNSTTTITKLDGSVFRMVSYKGVETPADSKYTISFDAGKVSAKVCNSMSGNYSLDVDLLKVGNLVSTQMYCTAPAGVMDIETDLGNMLTFGTKMYIGPNKLTLVSKEGVVMVFAGFTN